MRVNRRFLYWGIFLVALGGVLVATDLSAVDTTTLTDALRLWPLAIIAVGLSLVLRKTRFSVPGLLLGAALPGLLVGGVLAVAPRFVGDCGRPGEPANVATTQGAFDGPATVSIRIACGSLNARTVPGNGWQIDAGNTSGRTRRIDATARSLSVDGTSDEGNVLEAGRDTWNLALPTSDLETVSLIVFAGQARVDLPDARIQRLLLTANAGEITVDASAASVAELTAVVNVGSMSFRLPAAGDLVGSFRVGAGEVRICAPPGLGLRVTSNGTAERVTVNGLQQHGSEWQSPAYASATHRADLRISATFGAVEIDPIGGCK